MSVGRVCLFGYFSPESTRAWMIAKGLADAGLTVTMCRTERPGLLSKLADLRRQFVAVNTDAVLVMFPGQYILPFAWLLAKWRGVPLVLDAFISQYDTLVHDRRLVSERSPMAVALKAIDWLACSLADAVLIDTDAHRTYFTSAFGVRPEKMIVVPVGSRYDVFRPADAPKPGASTVLFQGSFIPLQGVDVILRAAAIVQRADPTVAFRFLGRGQTRAAMEALAGELGLRNTSFIDPLPIDALAEEIRRAHIGLGIFGTTEKAGRVVPHKAFDTLACACPLITGDSAASQAMLRDGETALLTPMGDAEALATAILRLKDNPSLAAALAANGRRLIEQSYQPATVVAPLAAWLLTRR